VGHHHRPAVLGVLVLVLLLQLPGRGEGQMETAVVVAAVVVAVVLAGPVVLAPNFSRTSAEEPTFLPQSAPQMRLLKLYLGSPQ